MKPGTFKWINEYVTYSSFIWVPISCAAIALIQYLFVRELRPAIVTFVVSLPIIWIIHVEVWSRPIVARIFLCRFPFLFGAVLAILPFVASRTDLGKSILGSLFVMTKLQIGVTTFLTLLAAWSAVWTATVIQRHAKARFGLDRLKSEATEKRKVWSKNKRIATCAVLHLPIVYVALTSSAPPLISKLVAWAIGAIGAIICLSLAVSLREFLVPPEEPHDAFLDPITLKGPLAYLHKQDRVSRNKAIQFIKPGVHWIFRKLLGPGYYDNDNKKLRSGHLYAISLFIVVLIVYWIGYFIQKPTHPLVPLPALGYLLMLILLLMWLLSGLSFYFDYYRTPCAFVIIGLCLFNYSVYDRDHVFTDFPLTSPNGQPIRPLTANEAVSAWLAQTKHDARKPVMVVVAASGGGIAASAWTTQVLTGLEEEVGPVFQESVAFISAVSGGAVGTMYYLDRLHSRNPEDLEKVREAGRSSSLEATAWGLTYPDLLNLTLPPILNPSYDRGWAIERAWEHRLRDRKESIGSWILDVQQGFLPAFVFNATIAENGQRLLLGPIKLSSSRQVSDYLSEKDICVVTAARLSSTFPFVSPLTREHVPQGRSSGYHVADGGYFDNFGVMTVIEWLQEVLDVHSSEIDRVLLIEIRAYPQKQGSAKAESALSSEIFGPLSTILNVRTSTQPARNDLELSLFKNRWAEALPIESVVLAPPQDGPLSWQLTDAEICSIQTAWKKMREGPQVALIKNRLLRERAYEPRRDEIDDKCKAGE